MKRLLKAISDFSIIGLIGTYPKTAVATMLLTGVGGIVASGNFTPPTLIPQPSVQFSPSNPGGTTSNTVRPNNGTSGPFLQPTVAANSWTVLWKSQINASMGYLNNTGQENVGSPLFYLVNGNPGLPPLLYQRTRAGLAGAQWWNNPSWAASTAITATAGTGYFTGFYPWVATGNCIRPPSGIWAGGSNLVQTLDLGFGCSVSPTISAATIPLSGAQQATGLAASPAQAATTCTPNSPTSGVSHTVTVNLAVAHGVNAGQTYTLQGFNNTGFTGYGSTATPVTYTALPTTTATTLVGFTATGGGACTNATSPVTTGNEGTALSGINSTFTVPAIPTTTPFTALVGTTGITTKNNQRACYAVGEYGSDNPLFPGAAFITAVDDKGLALQGAPAEPLWLNQGATNFVGFSTGTSTLTVTSMNSFSLPTSGVSFTGGKIAFTMGSTPGLIPGSEFVVSGLTNVGGTANLNQTYVVVTPTTTTATGTAITGVPLSGPAGKPQAIAGTIGTIGSSSASLVGVILPGMTILGASTTTMIDPYGTSSTSGVGGAGTYIMSATPTALGGGSTPGTNLFAWASHYYTAAATGTPLVAPGGTTAAVANTADGDLFPVIGALTAALGNQTGFGGSYSDWAMLYGSFPQNADGSPATTGANSLASLCTSQVGLPAFAATNGMTVHSRYEMNDLGVLGDSSIADATGSVTSNALTITAGAPLTTPWANGLFVSGNGLCTSACPTITGNSGVSNYTLSATYSSPITSEAIKIGTYTQASPFAASNWKGYIDGSNILHVTSLDNGSQTGLATFTGSLSMGFSGNISPGSGNFTGVIASNVLTVSGITGTPLQVGSAIVAPTVAAGVVITSLGTGTGGNGTYNVASANVASTTMTNGGAIGQNVLSVTSPGLNQFSSSVGIGTIVNTAPGGSTMTGGTAVLNAVTEGVNGQSNAFLVSAAQPGSGFITSQAMRGTGPIPGPPTALDVSSVSGTIGSGMYVTDGATGSIGNPLLVTGGSGTAWIVAGNYYQPISADTTMVGSFTNLVPGTNFTSPTMGYPVKVGAWSACSVVGAVNGGLGCYTLSNNLNGAIGSPGTPVIFTGSSLADGGPIAPGPALTIRDQGPGITFLTTPGATTGTMKLSGTYDVPTLGGTPTHIQALVSLATTSANGVPPGDPIPGCSACGWTNVSSEVISGGNWSGTVVSIPSGGPYYVAVRASNTTATYAAMPNSVRIGKIYTVFGQGQAGGVLNNGTYTPYNSGLWSTIRANSRFAGILTPIVGPDIPGTQGGFAYPPGVSLDLPGDRFSTSGGGSPFSEGTTNLVQNLGDATGAPVSFMDLTRDGVGAMPALLGTNLQTQTIAKADGVKTVWCSTTSYCPNAGLGAQLTFNAAGLTGASLTGSIGAGGTTLTVNTLTSGALEPGMVLSIPPTGSGFSGNPKLLDCVTNCTGVNGATSTWELDSAPCSSACSAIAMFADPISPGAAPWHYFNAQGQGLDFNLTTGMVIKPGSFSLFDRTANAVLCTDSVTTVYNVTAGNCTGATIDATKTFINYIAGDYEIGFSTPPLSGHVLEAQFMMNVTSTIITPPLSRPLMNDWFGDGTTAGVGLIQANMNRAPDGVTAYIYAGWGGTDEPFYLTPSYQIAGPGYSQAISWLYGTKFPTLLSGPTTSTVIGVTGEWRIQGPNNMLPSLTFKQAEDDMMTQWSLDFVTKSQFTATINAGVSPPTMTLTSAATGPMWTGEVIACLTVTVSCPMMQGQTGAYIVALQSGTWGASGSVYDLGGSPVSVTGQTLYNAVQSPVSNPTLWLGGIYDIGDQVNTALAGTTTAQPHPGSAVNTYRRSSSRWAAMLWGGDPNNTAPATDPQIDRVKANVTGCDAAATVAPCFDIGTTYQATGSATWTVTGGVATFTLASGISPHARPFVVGQVVTCGTCSGTPVITAVSVPPTQSAVTGAGQVSQALSFTTAGGTITASSGTVHGTCSGTSGTGSNCIDIGVAITNAGTFGTAQSLATCGVNTQAGNSQNFVIPKGLCSDPGIGELVNGFRIGTAQTPLNTIGGTVNDDGLDIALGSFNQSAAFTCNIVAAKVIQCVKGPAYTSGVFTSIGIWNSYVPSTGAGTFISYGNLTSATARIGTNQGYVGGQSFLPIGTSGGSGFTTGVTTSVAAVCPIVASGGHVPLFDITVSGGGVITNIQPAAISSSSTPAFGLGIGVSASPPVACTLTPTMGGGSGVVINLNAPPFEGVGGIGDYGSDANKAGVSVFDNSGKPGNPFHSYFQDSAGTGYLEPGLPLRPFGLFQSEPVSG